MHTAPPPIPPSPSDTSSEDDTLSDPSYRSGRFSDNPNNPPSSYVSGRTWGQKGRNDKHHSSNKTLLYERELEREREREEERELKRLEEEGKQKLNDTNLGYKVYMLT